MRTFHPLFVDFYVVLVLCCLPGGLDPCGHSSPFLERNKKIPLSNGRCLWSDGSNPGGGTEGVGTQFDSKAFLGNT